MTVKRCSSLLILFVILCACTKDKIETNCTLEDYDIEANSWTPIDESIDIGCSLYLEAFSWEGELYFAVGSHCADVAFVPYQACTNERICERPQSNACIRFLHEKEDLGIVAYWKD